MSDARPILWHVPMARSMRVRWLLEEIGCDYELRELSFFDRSMRQPPYSAVNPMGRVPSLEIDGVILRESGAAIEYLCETRAPDLGRSPGHAGRADWLNWLHFAETLGQHLAGLTQQHIVLRDDHMRSPTVMRLEAARLAKGLGIVGQAVADHDWLMPEGFSGVDCGIGYAVEIASRFVRFDPLPEVAAYLDRCRARPAYQASVPPDGKGPIYSRDFYEVPADG
jgi:glutathione S-transferase